jgi:hypothetical protein
MYQSTRYVYVTRNTCQLTPEVSNICLEMYISEHEEDSSIISKQRRIATNLGCPIIIDVYYQYDGGEVMLWYKTYTVTSDTQH